jgi:hypothetical protein
MAGYAALGKFKGMPDSGPPTAATIFASTAADGIIESIKSPTTFYAERADGDWLPESVNTLWNTESDNKKSIYDPCPKGWRVPLSGGGGDSPWNGLSNSGFSSGYDWSNPAGTGNGKYPATGLRFHTTMFTYSAGSFLFGGSAGAYWSASTASYPYVLAFTSDGVSPSDIGGRAFGSAVRCVQE